MAIKLSSQASYIGTETFLLGNSGALTSARTFESGFDFIRAMISEAGERHGKGFKDFGERIVANANDPSSVCFQVAAVYEKNDARCHFNCFGYALSTFGEPLEVLTRKKMPQITSSASRNIDAYVAKFFVNTMRPQEGDLALYSTDEMLTTPMGFACMGTTHAGIYRDINGGIIESKWGYHENPYVFQHDVFFTPDYYGRTVKFYRFNGPV